MILIDGIGGHNMMVPMTFKEWLKIQESGKSNRLLIAKRAKERPCATHPETLNYMKKK